MKNKEKMVDTLTAAGIDHKTSINIANKLITENRINLIVDLIEESIAGRSKESARLVG